MSLTHPRLIARRRLTACSSKMPWVRTRAKDRTSKDQWAHVVAGTADMRSEPSMQAPLVYALPSGWQVRVISRQPGWVQVQDANSGAAGWVESSAHRGRPWLERSSRAGRAIRHTARISARYDPRYAEEGYPYGRLPAMAAGQPGQSAISFAGRLAGW